MSEDTENLIRERTNHLRSLLNKNLPDNKGSLLSNSYEKIQRLKDHYKGYKALIVTCGPSFNDYKEHIYKIVNDKTILICVKRTFQSLPVADFHITGAAETQLDYGYEDQQPIVLRVILSRNINQKYNPTDITFVNYGSGRRMILYDIINNIDSMSWEKNLDRRMNFNKGHSMHGIALPLCILLGITDIFVIGWDGLVPGVQHSHFYGNGLLPKPGYGTIAVVECNKYITQFLKNRWNINIFQVNERSLYTDIPKLSADECIKYSDPDTDTDTV